MRRDDETWVDEKRCASCQLVLPDHHPECQFAPERKICLDRVNGVGDVVVDHVRLEMQCLGEMLSEERTLRVVVDHDCVYITLRFLGDPVSTITVPNQLLRVAVQGIELGRAFNPPASGGDDA